MRGMLVGKPVGAVVLEPSEARVLLGSSVPVGGGGGVVALGAKVSTVGTSIVVASLVPVGTMLWGAGLVDVEGVGKGEDSDSVTTGTTAVADSSDDVAALSVEEGLSVPVVIADSAEPEAVDDADDSDEPALDDEEPDVVEASEAPEEVPDAVDSPDVSDALIPVDVAVPLPVAEDSTPDVGSPDPLVLVALSSVPVAIGTTGTMVLLLEPVAVSLELLEGTVDGFRVG